MNAHTTCHRKTHTILNHLLGLLQVLATLAFLVAGPLKLITTSPLTLDTLTSLDATQWVFYLSGSIGGLKLFRDASNTLFTQVSQAYASLN